MIIKNAFKIMTYWCLLICVSFTGCEEKNDLEEKHNQQESFDIEKIIKSKILLFVVKFSSIIFSSLLYFFFSSSCSNSTGS